MRISSNRKAAISIAFAATAAFYGCITPESREAGPVEEIKSSTRSFDEDSRKVFIPESDAIALQPRSAALAKASANPLALSGQYKAKMKYIAQALAKAMRHPDVASQIKSEVGRRFDGDLNVLYSDIQGRPAGGTTFGELLNSRFGGLSAEEIRNLFDMKLLQIAVPVGYDKWKGDSPLMVGFMTYEVDDRELETVTAFDADLKEYTLSAKTEPDFPVVILSLNERINPLTMRLKSIERDEAVKNLFASSRALRKTASSPTAQHIYMEWFKTTDTYDPWPASDGEFSMGVMTDVKDASDKYYAWTQHVKDGVKSGSWYQRHIGLFQYDPAIINKHCFLKYHEDDTWEFDVTMSMSIKASGVVDKSVSQTLNGSAKIGNGDDIVGGNQFNVALGPMNLSQAAHTNVLQAGTVQFASWWGDMNNDGELLGLPFAQDASNAGKADRWPVSGWQASPDFTYAMYVETPVTLDINTCGVVTNFDTYMTVYNRSGIQVAHNDDAGPGVPGCSNLNSKLSVYLTAGHYYINVQGYMGAVGNFRLNVNKL